MKGLLSLLVAGCFATAASAGEGRYRLVGGQAPIGVVANGYVQTVTPDGNNGWDVHVSVSLNPVGAMGSWQPQRGQPAVDAPPGFELPSRLEQLVRRESDPWEAATVVLRWVADHVRVDPSDDRPQDARSVLRRGLGRCSGLANLTAALLLTAGFEARTVSGLLVSSTGATPHRWVECQLPGAGWVPTDPTLGLWVVTSGHVAFADSVVDPPRVEVKWAEPTALDRLPRDKGRRLRPNRGADLICRIEGGGRAVATLTGGNDVRRVVLAPDGRFDGLLPGRWTLEVASGGRIVERRRLTLQAGRVHDYTVGLTRLRAAQ
jgi:hypothetical protein